ncbi:MAG: 50S ribosomal protein L9, partial [Bacteroidetes bacterium CG18_big_fil_WC_8_21_14_2_50_41_14]
MEVILKQDVNGVGDKNDLLIVKNGFGRNYLIPKGLAVLADKSGKKVLAE